MKQVLSRLWSRVRMGLKEKQNLLLLAISISAISLPSLFSALIGVSADTYVAHQIYSNNETSVVRQELKGKNFLQNNDFYIGYEFNNIYTTPDIKTVFHYRPLEEEKLDYQAFFFSKNTGMSSDDYLVPNLLKLKLVEGKAFSHDWKTNEAYMAESFYKKVFGDTPLENVPSFVHCGVNLQIVGKIGNESLHFLSAFNETEDLLFTSYTFALSYYETYAVESYFTVPDLAGSERYLHRYFARYNVSLKEGRMLYFGHGLASKAVISETYHPNAWLPAVIILLQVSAVLLMAGLKYVEKKDFKSMSYRRFVALSIVMLAIFALLDKYLFKATNWLFLSSINTVVVLVLIAIISAGLFVMRRNVYNEPEGLPTDKYKIDGR